MDLHYKQEVTVGALVIVAVIAFTAGLTWLSGKSLFSRGGIVVPVRFANVGGLKVGDPVRVSGVKVGQVDNVALEGPSRVMVYLRVEPSARPRADAKAQVVSQDFFGAKIIDYVPGTVSDPLPAGQAINGLRETALMDNASDLASRASEVLTGAQDLLSKRTSEDVHATMAAAERALNVISKVGEGPVVKEATATLEQVRRLAMRLDSTFANPAINKSVSQMNEVTTNLNEMTEGLRNMSRSLASMTAKMDSSQGTLGRVVNDTTLYHDLHELSLSMKKLLDDMRERPGRYFNLKVF